MSWRKWISHPPTSQTEFARGDTWEEIDARTIDSSTDWEPEDPDIELPEARLGWIAESSIRSYELPISSMAPYKDNAFNLLDQMDWPEMEREKALARPRHACCMKVAHDYWYGS